LQLLDSSHEQTLNEFDHSLVPNSPDKESYGAVPFFLPPSHLTYKNPDEPKPTCKARHDNIANKIPETVVPAFYNVNSHLTSLQKNKRAEAASFERLYLSIEVSASLYSVFFLRF
jgi:hypothetical protein